MKQVLRKGLNSIVVDDVPDPLPPPHHVVVRSMYSLISSGTESASLHQGGALKALADNPSHLTTLFDAARVNGPIRTLAEAYAKFSEYAVLGYSGAGVVVDKHPTVTDVAIGDRVAYGGEGTGHAEAVVTGRYLVAPIPDVAPYRHACFATLGSIALNAVRTARITLGDRVVVLGLGLVGQLVAQLARLHGGLVVASDLRGDRVEVARRLGAAHAVSGDAGLADVVKAITDGHGADAVILAAASKSPAPCRQALRLLRERGRITIVGNVTIDLPWHEMYMKDAGLAMSRAYGPGSYDPTYEREGRDYPLPYVRWTQQRNMTEFLRLVEAKQVELDALITHEFDLDDAPRAYRIIVDGTTPSLGVLLRYPATRDDDAAQHYRPRRTVALSGPTAGAGANGTLGVAVVGAGNLARWSHLPVLRGLSGVQLRAIHSSNPARGKNYALRFGSTYCTTDLAQILGDPETAAIVITSRHQYHASQARAALEAGKHVFVEKPMGITEQECLELCEAVRRTGRLLGVGFNRRFAPLYQELKRCLRGRATPAVVTCRVSSPAMTAEYWMSDPAVGGAFIGEGCHFVDLMAWLLDAEPVAVAAHGLPTGRRAPIGENNVVATLRFSDDSIGTLTYCTLGARRGGGECVEVYAGDLTATVNDFRQLVVRRGRRITRRRHLWPDKGYAAELKSFFDAVRDGRRPEVDERAGFRATLVCRKILECAAGTGAVSIDLDGMI